MVLHYSIPEGLAQRSSQGLGHMEPFQYSKELGCHSKYNRKPLEDFKWVSDVICLPFLKCSLYCY